MHLHTSLGGRWGDVVSICRFAASIRGENLRWCAKYQDPTHPPGRHHLAHDVAASLECIQTIWCLVQLFFCRNYVSLSLLFPWCNPILQVQVLLLKPCRQLFRIPCRDSNSSGARHTLGFDGGDLILDRIHLGRRLPAGPVRWEHRLHTPVIERCALKLEQVKSQGENTIEGLVHA